MTNRQNDDKITDSVWWWLWDKVEIWNISKNNALFFWICFILYKIFCFKFIYIYLAFFHGGKVLSKCYYLKRLDFWKSCLNHCLNSRVNYWLLFSLKSTTYTVHFVQFSMTLARKMTAVSRNNWKLNIDSGQVNNMPVFLSEPVTKRRFNLGRPMSSQILF